MARPEEVQDNVATMLDMVGSMQGVVELAPAGDSSTDCDQGQDNSSSHKQAAQSGLSPKERELLARVREVLQPVQDVTWPVGLTDNRK
jgi:hypothetical protein